MTPLEKIKAELPEVWEIRRRLLAFEMHVPEHEMLKVDNFMRMVCDLVPEMVALWDACRESDYLKDNGTRNLPWNLCEPLGALEIKAEEVVK